MFRSVGEGTVRTQEPVTVDSVCTATIAPYDLWAMKRHQKLEAEQAKDQTKGTHCYIDNGRGICP